MLASYFTIVQFIDYEYTAILWFLKAEEYPFLWMIYIGFNCSHIDGNVTIINCVAVDVLYVDFAQMFSFG